MRTYKQEFLGQTISIANVPETADEFDKLAGEVGACVDAAVAQEVLHGYGGKWRDRFAQALEDSTIPVDENGVRIKDAAPALPWPVDDEKTANAPKKKDGTVTPIHISPANYYRIFKAKTGKTDADLAALAQQVADSLPFDLKPSEGSTRVSKANRTAAESLLNDANPDRAINAVETLKQRNPGLEVELDPATGRPTVDSLAAALATERARREREELANLGL